jgi:DNA-binding XRE family transcriptional regulator
MLHLVPVKRWPVVRAVIRLTHVQTPARLIPSESTARSAPARREWRERHDLTQAALAARLGGPSNTLARWERDDMGMRHTVVLAAALETIERDLRAGRVR